MSNVCSTGGVSIGMPGISSWKGTPSVNQLLVKSGRYEGINGGYIVITESEN